MRQLWLLQLLRLYIAHTAGVPRATTSFRNQPPLSTFGPFLLLPRQARTPALNTTLNESLPTFAQGCSDGLVVFI